jgi:oligopeptide transport system substrate-binding protein
MLPSVTKKILLLIAACLFSACNQQLPIEEKQQVRLNIFTEPPSLDSRKATDLTSVNVLLMLFEGLTRMGEDHRPKLALAERISISEDGCTYTFILKETYWSNGEKVRAHDFLYAWSKILEPKFPSFFAYKFYLIENAEEIKSGKLPLNSLGVMAPNDQTLIVTLKHPAPYFLELLSFPFFFPVNQKVDKKNPNWALDAGPDFVCNGPFLLNKWVHESEINLVKNPNYWDTHAVKLQNLHLAMIDDTSTEFYMYEMNELDWAGSPLSNLTPEMVPVLKANNGAAFYPAAAVYYYKVNTQRYPLNHVKIRQALSYAINRKDIVSHILQAGQTPASGIVPPMPGWETPAVLFKDGDTLLARQLFEEALEDLGITRAEFPTLTLSYNTNREHQKIAEAIQHQWKDTLDIHVQLSHSDWKVYLSKISKQEYEIARMGWVGDFGDPLAFLEPFKFRNDPGTGGNNDTGWEDPEYKFLLEQTTKESDSQKRAVLLRKAEALLVSEMPVIPLYYIVYGYLKKPYLKDVYLSPFGTIDFKHAYIEARL